MPQLQPQQQRLLGQIQYSVQLPTPFLDRCWRQLLPDWSRPVGSVFVLLQQAPIALLDRTLSTEACKHRLRQQFLIWAGGVAAQLRQSAYLAAVFDPCTGFPIDSGAGELRLDDVAIVRSLLGYAIVEQGGCSVILHPQWGGAVYPSVLLSSASPPTVEQTIQAVWQQQQWQPAPVGRQFDPTA